MARQLIVAIAESAESLEQQLKDISKIVTLCGKRT